MNMAFPFSIDASGRSSAASADDHVRQMIEQLLFTAAGERVNRPDFGGGLMQLIFAMNSPELASALEFTLQAGLQQYLGDLIDLQALKVVSQDSTLGISVQYLIRRTGASAVSYHEIPV